MFLGSTEAALMGSFTPISRRPPKCAMTAPWIRSDAGSAPMCKQASNLHGTFAGQRKIGMQFPMRAASVDPKSTQHTTTKIKNDFSSPTSNRLYSTSFVKTNAWGGLTSSRTAVLTDF